MSSSRLLVVIGVLLLVLTAGAASAASQRADAVLLVNSASDSYADAQRLIRPYLDNFGVPYTVLDIATTQVGTGIGDYALIIIGHRRLDPTHARLDATEEANIAAAVQNGAGLVNFDNDLSPDGRTARYQYVQSVFGFGYVAAPTGGDVTFPGSAPTNYITGRHDAFETITTGGMTLAGITLSPTTTSLADVVSVSQPFLAVTTYGQGRAVQWGSYAWMSLAVKGPLYGLDDLVWRSLVWAARKPFVMRGLPNFLTMRVDDAKGGFFWAQTATSLGFKPWLGLFYHDITDADAAILATLVNAGKATATVHALSYTPSDGTFFYFDHYGVRNFPDTTVASYYTDATNWHSAHNIPIGKFVVPHFYESGTNVFGGLQTWGVQFVGVQIAPGGGYSTSNWVQAGPYRLYDTPGPAATTNPGWYADYLTVPGHPEFANRFFNCVTEIRDDAGYEWYPSNDVAVTIGRGTRQSKRAFDSMALATLFTHEYNIQPITPGNWLSILTGITGNLASYNPIFVTMDYACQYVRATRTSDISTSVYDTVTRNLTTTLTGTADMPTQFFVYNGAGGGVSTTTANVPAFTSPTQVVYQVPLPDVTPPAAVVNLATSSPAARSITLTWTAPGDDGNTGTATQYDIRYRSDAPLTEASWSTATPVSSAPTPAPAGTVQSLVVADLSPSTTYYFGLKTADEAANWSAVSNSPSGATTAAPPSIGYTGNGSAADPPSANYVNAFRYQATTNLTVTVMRAFIAAAGTGQMKLAVYADNNGAPGAFLRGTEEKSLLGTGWQGFNLSAPLSLTQGAYYWLVVWTNDDAYFIWAASDPNACFYASAAYSATWPSPFPAASGHSGFRYSIYAEAAVQDTAPPAAVIDLAAGAPTASSITLRWTAPGNDGNVGTASQYDVRYRLGGPVTDANWSGATPVTGAPAPAPAGTPQSLLVIGLSPGTPYYFALKTADAVPNWSGISNSPTATTTPVDHIIVTPSLANVPANTSRQFAAQGFDAGGNTLPGLTYTWTTTGGGTIDQTGLFTAGAATGTFTHNVVATSGGVSGSASASVVARTLDHFTFDAIPGPVYSGAPFGIRITAYDQVGGVLTTYAGPAQLSDTTGTLAPTATGSFAAGVWSGAVTITQIASSVVIQARDASGAVGTSTPLAVQGQPDLVETSVSNPPATSNPGGTFSVTDTTANQGAGGAVASTTRYYLSLDTAKNTGDILLTGTRAVPALGAGATSTGAVTVTIPAGTAAGGYYLLACTDDTAVAPESNEANNCLASVAQVQVQVQATGPDLVETTVSNPPAAAAPGSTFSVTDTAANQGAVSAAASKTRYLLSLDTTLDAGDTLMTGTRSVPALAAGATSSGTLTLTIPSTTVLGTYYVLACADYTAVVTETNETNNCRASATRIQVTRPDLVETAVSNPPSTVRVGGTLQVTDTAANQGLLSAAATRTRYYLSLDTVKDATDIRMSSYRSVPALAAGASSTGTVTLTVPTSTAAGAYYLLACADDTALVTETNETNNCLASGTQVQVTP